MSLPDVVSGLLLSERPAVRIRLRTLFQKIAKVIFHVKDGLRIFHFEPITKISQRMPLAEFSVPANKIGFPANEAP